MYLVDLEKNIIHDMSFVRYECKIKSIPEDKRKKLYSLQTVKRLFEPSNITRYNGCEHCMSEHHTVDLQRLFA